MMKSCPGRGAPPCRCGRGRAPDPAGPSRDTRHATSEEAKPLTTESITHTAGPDTAGTGTPRVDGETTGHSDSEQHTFADLGLLSPIVDALSDVGITHPFPIQQMAIPVALTGADLIGQARTGTGKTIAFGSTLLQRIVLPNDADYEAQAKPGAPQGLVVTPTRELAGQVAKDIQTACKHRSARVLTVYGGVGYDEQLAALESGVDVVVGTPGRLLDLADRGSLDLAHIKVLVLDEADEMLDLGFLPDVERILDATPELRQSMLFSATMPAAIVSLARRHLRHPLNIRAESGQEEATVPTTAQFVYQAHDLDKPEVVARILQAESSNKTMIFCRTKRTVQRVADDLTERGFSVAPLHGDLSQVVREKTLRRFRDGQVSTIVATEVAARGIDVEGVSHVINYECPEDQTRYLHRIGRTGRAGASGVAITFVDWSETTRWKVINSALGLPFDEPQETYSTSEHLFHDLGIDRSATGRLKSAEPQQHTGNRRNATSGRGKSGHGQRNRVRMRNGVPVDQSGGNAGHGSGDQSAGSAGSSDEGSSGSSSSRRRRSRRRRRPAGNSGQQSPSGDHAPSAQNAVQDSATG